MGIKFANNALLLLLAMMPSLAFAAGGAGDVTDHRIFDGLLKKYVDARHRVDYAGLKKDGMSELIRYLAKLVAPWPANLAPAARDATLINAYNALTIRWILEHYPVVSIWKTSKPFTKQRHKVNGKEMSLDDIETQLRETVGPRAHSVLVCAALSCPPLRREAYAASRLDEQLDSNTREWLQNKQLNEFSPERRRADVSSIFKWYRQDFTKDGNTLAGFLAKYGPPEAQFLNSGKGDIEFREYRWGLNDISNIGEKYSGWSFKLDYLKNK